MTAGTEAMREAGTRQPRGRGWLAFLRRRLAQGALVVAGAMIVGFFLVHVTGDPAEVLAGASMSPERIELLRHELGYDRPLAVQFVDFVGGILRGDLGDSIRYGEPALASVLEALPNTLFLVAVAIVMALLVAVPMAVVSVMHRGDRWELGVRTAVVVGQGLPEFWLGLLLALVFSVWLGWLPSIGFTEGFRSVVLPAVSVAVPLAAMFLRLLRSQLIEVSQAEFMDALRAKGVPRWQIVTRHGLRNAAIPFLTFLALQMGWLVGGALVVEAVFAWPGIGTLLLGAVQTRDLPVVQGIIVVIAVVYVVLNLTVDIVVGLVDPRIRTGASA